MKNYTEIPNYLTSKEADIYLVELGGEAKSWWFKLENRVLCIDYLPSNHPQLEVFVFETIKKAQKRLREMVKNENWELITNKLGEEKI